ncbi:hypothetical protein CLU79DRAFT_716985 [Phycomyces nitens]|nr:hypothetical protein CLU79DRAFT_716985 [Phycomyces nitens]
MGIDPLQSRFQKMESRPRAESYSQVTDPTNCISAKLNTKSYAKFNAKSSDMFAVKSNVWLKASVLQSTVQCLVCKQSSMSSWISEFNAKFEVEFSTKLDFQV